jgi:S-DNA-T family DNA segregation ATPase FtsK/SpoIIIE
MRLQLTLVRRHGGLTSPSSNPLEIEVEAPPGSTARELATALATALPSPIAPASAAQDSDPTQHGLQEPAIWVGGVLLADDAPVGAALIVDGAAITLGSRPSTPTVPRGSQRTPVALSIAHGPDAGRTVELGVGVHTVGRSEEATICLDDPRTSRLHASINITTDTITLADLASTNGTYLDDSPVGTQPLPLVVGSTVRIGDTLLILRPVDAVPAATTLRPDGTRAVNRRPRLLAPPAPVSIALPTPPDEPRRTRVPWIAMALPVPFSAVMAIFFGPTMLAFALMSPLLMAGTTLSDRVGSKRTYAAEHAAYERHLASAHERVVAACAEETRSLRRSLPDPSQILAIATIPTARLWERRRGDADALTVSIGRCTTPASLRVIRPTGDPTPEHPALQRVPCALPLATIGVLGVCGERAAVLALLRVVIGQLATLHSPLDLDLVLIAGSRRADDSWSWLSRLPHVRGPDGRPGDQWVTSLHDDAARTAVTELAQRVRARRTASTPTSAPWSGPRTVVVLDGASALRGLPDLAEVLEYGPSVGICVLALNGDRAELPSETGAVLDLTTPAHASLHLPGAAATDLVVDRVGLWWADRLSRALAPLRDATPGGRASSLPTSLGLAELLGRGQATDPRNHDLDRPDSDGGAFAEGRVDGYDPRSADRTDAARLTHGWAQSPHRTSVPVGLTADGPFMVDLALDGPHILVAGTTGAGKSELLRSLVASLAVHNRPEHLSFVLIDYKGGAAFRECDNLPHVAGLVTDLDDHLADRALASMTAELKRRERLLADAGVADFVSYQSGSTSPSLPLARLVIVVDEFRALAEELPQFVEGMVRVAALGRSLGVHVVLATQRPAGVVTADIKANVNLRIALRVRDRADSDDVIDTPDAAGLDRAMPGRGYARAGGGSLVLFQAAHAGGRSRATEPRGIRVRVVEWDRSSAPWPDAPDADAVVTDLAAVVDVVSEAAALVGARPAPSPWLPALPTHLGVGSLPPAKSASCIAIGLADEPAAQRQWPLEVDLATPGHWGFVGTAGSGRSNALLTVALRATSALDRSRLHVYAVSGGSLSGLESLPHCGAHAGWDDLPRLERLVARLSADVADRRQRLSASPHATFADWWQAGDALTPPALLLVVDDWDVLAQRTDDVTHGTLVDRLLGVLREGAGVGLTGVLAGDRALLVGRTASALTHRVLLRLADRTDVVLAGLPAKAVPAQQPPGRGVLLDGTEVQVALPPSARESRPVQADGEAASTPPEADLATDPAQPTATLADQARPGRTPWRVDALPGRVDAALLSRPAGHDDVVLIGLGGDELAPLGLSPERDGRRWIVSGSNGTGVSTTLTAIAADLLSRDHRVAVIASRPGPWGRLRRDPRVTWCDDPTRPEELAALRRSVPGLAVLVDNADELLDSAIESALKQVAALVDRDGGLIVGGANAGALSVQYRGLAVELGRHRTGIMLGPASTAESDLFGVRVPVDRAAAPGRGYLVRGGVATALQAATCNPVQLHPTAATG